jgi:hypothetical protein
MYSRTLQQLSFQSPCNDLYFYKQCRRILVDPYLPYLLSSTLPTLLILLSVQNDYKAAFICASFWLIKFSSSSCFVGHLDFLYVVWPLTSFEHFGYGVSIVIIGIVTELLDIYPGDKSFLKYTHHTSLSLSVPCCFTPFIMLFFYYTV